MNRFRTGFGYDVHQLVPGRPLIIGGIQIPYTKGALGHSDADVLLHAIADALLGATAMGDIGQHFPDHDPEIKDISSKKILSHVNKLISEKAYQVSNIDSTVVLQEPKLHDYIPEIRKQIADVFKLDIDQVSVKASTTEHLGFIGKREGVAAYAVVMVYRENFL